MTQDNQSPRSIPSQTRPEIFGSTYPKQRLDRVSRRQYLAELLVRTQYDTRTVMPYEVFEKATIRHKKKKVCTSYYDKCRESVPWAAAPRLGRARGTARGEGARDA